MSVAPARRAALSVLARVREREAFGAETLDAVLRRAPLSPADAALATRLAYGTLESLGVLDEALDRYLERPDAVEPAVRDALRLAAYELLFSRTPPRAAVNEGVEAVKAVRRQAAGMANAVLRRVAEAAPSFPWGDPDTDDAALARATRHPEWIVRSFIDDLGRDRAVQALWADAEPAPLYLWHNPFAGPFGEALAMLESDGAGPEAEGPPGCIRVREAQAAVRGDAVAAGRVLITDAAAQIAARACGAWPGGTIVDLAAGRGTKTAQLQALAVEHGAAADVYAVDVHPFKAKVLETRMAQLRVPGVTALVGDGTDLSSIEGLPARGTADAVLVDAPCSGLGTLRRKPDKRWRLTPADVARLAPIQARMLAEAASLVSVGGRVVYSTCSVSRTEDQDVVASFLASSDGAFRTAVISDAVPPEWRSDIGEEGWFLSVPRAGGPDGHFVAALTRVR